MEKQNKSCPVVKQCGGCQMLQLSYEKQLSEKQKMVDALLHAFGKPEPIRGMEHPWHYRNKVHAVFGTDRKGHVISGVYQAGSHIVVPVETCLIEDEKADAIIGTIRELLTSFKLKTYNEDTGNGFLRHVLIRTGRKTGEIMVVLVTGTPVFPSRNHFVKALREAHPEITTIVQNINNRRTSMVLGDREQVLYGKGYILDELCGLMFKLSPKSFYQVNPEQTEVLYSLAVEFAGLTGQERVLDAYCGIGTIGMIAGKAAKEVIGVELNPNAVRDARENAKRNQMHNIRFYEGDAGQFMRRLAATAGTGEKKNIDTNGAKKRQLTDSQIDVVFMDPPRAGSDEAFLSSVVTLGPKKVVYISCNPETLARDLKFLTRKGYRVDRMVPVDMFPMTEHVETVCLLSKKP